MSDRLSRKDIKQQDAFTESVGSAVEYVHSNQRLVAMVFAGALILGVFIAGVLTWLGYQKKSSNERLARAIQIYSAPLEPAAPKPDDPAAPSFSDEASRRAAAKTLFEDLAGGLGDTGEVANLYLAQIAMEEGDAAKARQLWQGFLADRPNDLAAAGVTLTLLDLDRAEGKADTVVTQLEGMIGQPGKLIPDDVLLHKLATTLDELGRRDEARKYWQRIIDEFPDSSLVSEARQATMGRPG